MDTDTLHGTVLTEGSAFQSRFVLASVVGPSRCSRASLLQFLNSIDIRIDLDHVLRTEEAAVGTMTDTIVTLTTVRGVDQEVHLPEEESNLL